MTVARSEPPDPQNGRDREDAGRPVRIGISACLLGESVRYDGGHKRDSFLIDGGYSIF